MLAPRRPLSLVSLLAFVPLVAFALAACGDDDDGVDGIEPIVRSPETSMIISVDEPITVGVSTALTGPVGERGSEYRDAVITGVDRWKAANGDQIAGHDIEVWAEDDGCTAANHAAIAASRLLNRPGLVGVIGPQCSGGVLAARAMYGEAGMVTISGGATRTDLTVGQPPGGFFFRTAFRNDLEGTFIGQFLINTLEADAVYLIDDSEPFGRDLANAAHRLLNQGGVTVIRRSINVGDFDFSELAAEIAAYGPDFVAFTGFNPEAVLLYSQIRDAGYDGLYGAGDGAASVPNFVEPVGAEEADGVLFSGCQFPLPEEFVADFEALHGYEPTEPFTGQYADAVTVLLDAVRDVVEAKGDGSLEIQPEALRDAVRATSLDGITGALAFDSLGDRVPEPGVELSDLQEQALTAEEDIFASLGLVPCQVQDGELVTPDGPAGIELRLP
jgi:branched-chain amino acid transport system substrate-binding protein